MAVFRVEKNSGYTVMSNHHLRNRALSLKAKGLLSQMLSLPEDWDYTLQGLARINRESIDAIRQAIRELEQTGYIQRSRERDEKGRLRGADYVIFELPQPIPASVSPTLENPTLENPTQENPTLENPMQLNEAASLMLCSIAEKKGDMLRYYNTTGAVRAVGVSHTSQPQLIEFYIETLALEDVEVRDLAGNLYTCQVSPHPRGRKISFIDTLSYGEEKEYIYTARHKAPETLNTRHCYMGAEEVRDIVNDYDPVTYRLPYEVENKFFRICYKPGDGITSFVDKRTGTEMAGTAIPFFTPVYQRTPLHQEVPFSSYEERRALGRNIRGKHAETHIGKLMEITCMEHGPVFTQLRLHYSLAGTVKADVLLKLYEAIPRIDFTLELGKTISDEVESVFLSLDLNRPGNGTVLRKGAREAFRPGIDQLPGTCMEFYMSDDGAARLSPEGGVLIAARDVPMFYTGEMQHHPIRLCDGAAENNARPLYSWVMNNNWETNFKMDLSGFCQYDYSLWLTDISDPEQAMDELHEQLFDPYVLIVR